VLGEKYVEIRPVSRDAPLVETGDVLTDVRGQMEIDEMVDGLSPLLKAIDPEAIRTLSDALRNDPERATRMLADTETLLHNAALTSEKLPAAVEEARETLAAARRTAASGDATLAQVNDTLARVQARVDAVPPEQVPQLLAELEAAARDGRAVMRKADGAAIKADALLDNWKDADWEALRRMAQEEGVFIRLTPYEGK
jgi:ABC-type transporter Mla subunit MlaD